MPNCATCSNATVCEACSFNYYQTSAATCSSKPFYFSLVLTTIFLACSDMISNCVACSGVNNCTACSSGFYVNSAQTCTGSLFVLRLTLILIFIACSSAMLGCITCSNASICTLCASGYFLIPASKNCTVVSNTIIVGRAPVNGYVLTNTPDYWNVSLISGGSYRIFEINPVNIWDTYLYLYRNTSSLSTYNNDNFGNSASAIQAYSAPYTGSYIVGAAGYSDNYGPYITQVTLEYATTCSNYTSSCTSKPCYILPFLSNKSSLGCINQTKSCTTSHCLDTFQCTACSGGLYGWGATCVASCPPTSVLQTAAGWCYRIFFLLCRCD